MLEPAILAGAEAQIMSLWDGGASIERIVAATGLRPKRVEDVVSIYHAGPTEAELQAARALPDINARFVEMALAAQARSAAREAEKMERERIQTRELNARLIDNIEALARELLPNGWREGNEWVTSNIFDDRTGSASLAVHVGSGHRRGWWRDFATTDKKGLPLALIAQVECGGDWKAAYRWAKDWLGIDDGPVAGDDPEVRARMAAERAARRIEMERRSAERVAAAEAEFAAIRKAAVARWQDAAVLSAGDPVTAYLRARGVDLAAMHAATGKRPGALRYHPSLQYGPNPSDGSAAKRFPAMVAMITALDGTHIATHRTWLDPERPAKVPLELLGGRKPKQKKVLGRAEGGHIPVWKGVHPQPLKDIPEGTEIWVTEGIEDALYAAQARPELRLIAAYSVGNLEVLALPPQMGRLVIIRDNDPPGSDADRAFRAAVQAHREQGRRVGVVRPPAGFKDLNEMAQRGDGE